MKDASEILQRLAATIDSRKGGDAGTSYVARLLAGPEDALLKKIGEEATETVLAAKAGDKLALVNEMADLWFHSLIVLARYGLGPDDVLFELKRREGISGVDEKAARVNSERIKAEKN
jgi:phosphoribosyl-ATP pyrophosphohydrolase